MDENASFIMLTDDGNTLLSVRQGQDGALELLSTPVTILPSTEDTWPLPESPTCDIPLEQINFNLPCNENQPQISSIEIVNQNTQSMLVPNETLNQSVEVRNDSLPVEACCKSNFENKQSLATTNVEPKQVPEKSSKSHKLKEPYVSLEKISVPTKKIMNKKLGKSKKGIKTERQQPCFKCDFCGQEFKKQYLLQKHLYEHAQDKPHHCPKCPATFNVPTNFTLHMATHNIGEPKCPECGRRFARIASLKAHMIKHEMDENLYCTECDDTFTTKSQLEAHLSLHNEKWTSDDSRRCRLCGKQFTKPVLYRQHLRDHYKLQMKSSKHTKRGIRHRTSYKCRICSKVFGKPSQLARHIRVHTGEKPYKCNICQRGFTQKGSVRIHMLQHKGIKPFSCSFCQAKFVQRGNLESHILRAHKVDEKSDRPVYRCTRCPCVFKRLGILNGHMKRVHGNESKEGATEKDESSVESMRAKVEQVMNRLADLESSVATNKAKTIGKTRDKGEEDEYGDEGFVAIGESEDTAIVTVLDKESNGLKGKYVKIMQRSTHGSRFYDCTFCHKTFKKPSDLVRHLRTHTQEKPFKCKVCNREFKLKAHLQSHMDLHGVGKDIFCDVCNIVVLSKKALEIHKEKCHKCVLCGKKFVSLLEQKNHAAVHVSEQLKKDMKKKVPAQVQDLDNIVLKEPLVITEMDDGELKAQPHYRNEIAHGKGRPHKCPACPLAFMKISHLKTHYTRHTDIKPFTCDSCDSTFRTKSTLKTHLLSHKNVKPHVCCICDRQFKLKSALQRHYLSHSNLRHIMCPYCKKTFKSKVNCKKHMKLHKQEIAQAQLEQQAKESIVISDQTLTVPSVVTNLALPTNDQISTAQTSDIKMENACFVVSSSSQPPVSQNIPVVNEPNIVGSAQTLHAGETGTMNLPHYNGSQTLSPENIRVIEEKLNQQLIGLGVNLTLGNVIKRVDHQSNADMIESQEQPMLSIIYENGTTLHSPVTVSASVNPNSYNPQFANIDINQIALQNNNAMNIGIVQADSTNVINILSNAIQENQQIMNGNVGVNLVFQPDESNRAVDDSSASNNETTKATQSSERLNNKKGNLECHVCKEEYLSPNDLKEHLETHAGKNEYRCALCFTEFRYNSGLTRHMKCHKDEEVQKCYECNQEFKTTWQLKQHIKEHVKKKPQLENQGNAEEIVTKLVINKKVKTKKGINKCTYCPKIFRKPSDLVRHVRTHTGERPYQCQLCKKSFAVKCTLDAHLKIHNSQKSFHCYVCDNSFVTKGSLKIHMRLHTGSTPFNCPECDQKFRTSGHLENHLLDHRSGKISSAGVENIKIELAQEEEQLQQQQSIEVDQNLVTNLTIPSELTFSAANDGEILTLDENNQFVANLQYLLANGLVTIQSQDPESNQVSLATTTIIPENFDNKNKTTEETQVFFSTESPDSTVPTSIQTNENDLAMVVQLDSVDSTVQIQSENASPQPAKSPGYSGTGRVCETCGKTFSKPNLLERHRRTHTGERPFKCDRCPKKFTQKSSLQTHYAKHTGVKPYNCTYCEKSFAQSGNLQKHVKRIHKVDPSEIKRTATQFFHYDPKILQMNNGEDEKAVVIDGLSLVDFLK